MRSPLLKLPQCQSINAMIAVARVCGTSVRRHVAARHGVPVVRRLMTASSHSFSRRDGIWTSSRAKTARFPSIRKHSPANYDVSLDET